MPDNDAGRPGLKLKKSYYETQVPDKSPAPENEATAIDVESHRETAASQRGRSRARRNNLAIIAGWLVFLALCAGLLYLRFVAELPNVPRDSIKFYGIIGTGVFYVLSIVMALKDNMFDGLLSIVIPFYPIYYLFAVCGSVFLRSLAAAFLIAFGYDCAMLLNRIAIKVIDFISAWIQNV